MVPKPGINSFRNVQAKKILRDLKAKSYKLYIQQYISNNRGQEKYILYDIETKIVQWYRRVRRMEGNRQKKKCSFTNQITERRGEDKYGSMI